MATVVESDYGPIDIDKGEAIEMTTGAAIFNPAIKASVQPSGDPCIVLATDGPNILIVDVNGDLHWRGANGIRLDWRYDFKAEKWVDANGEALEDEGE